MAAPMIAPKAAPIPPGHTNNSPGMPITTAMPARPKPPINDPITVKRINLPLATSADLNCKKEKIANLSYSQIMRRHIWRMTRCEN